MGRPARPRKRAEREHVVAIHRPLRLWLQAREEVEVTVHVGEMESTVEAPSSSTFPSTPATPAAADSARQEERDQRGVLERLARDAARTRAEGLDD